MERWLVGLAEARGSVSSTHTATHSCLKLQPQEIQTPMASTGTVLICHIYTEIDTLNHKNKEGLKSIS